MAYKTVLGAKAQTSISRAIDSLFERLKKRLLGPGAFGKIMIFDFNKDLSLTGLFEDASLQEGVKPREEVVENVLKIAGSYIDAHKEKTKARVLREVQAAVSNSQSSKAVDVEQVLNNQLLDVWKEVKTNVKTIVETESTIVRNTSIFDAVGRIGAMTNTDDPTVYFITVRDQFCCKECKTVHILPDGVTPRVWKMSEVASGYHTRGEDTPSVFGLHPNCRCILAHLLPGYGFTASGKITYVKEGHDEFAEQRG